MTNKETTPMFTFIKKKEAEDSMVYTFVGANTLPDRVPNQSQTGDEVAGEILSKGVLEEIAEKINDESTMGGDFGSYRTVSLFHDRVKTRDYTLEEAGFVIPGTAKVQEIEKAPGNYELLVDVEVNKMYVPKSYPDYSAEKIDYKIRKGALGLSVEYNNKAEQEKVVTVGEKKYNYVFGIDKFTGFGFARPNLIGNPGAVRVKEMLIAEELNSADNKEKGETQMEEAKIKEMEKALSEANIKIKELEEAKKAAEEAKDEGKVEEVEKKVEEQEAKIKEMKLAMDETATKMKESIELAFSGVQFNTPANNVVADKNVKVKEIYGAVEAKDFIKFKEATKEYLANNESKIKEMIARDGQGFDFEKWQTVDVKIKGNLLEVVPSMKTKDVLDTSDMAEATYYQTNAMFADRYVAGITETFLKEDSLMKVVPKINHIGGNDKFQWKLWVDYTSVDGDNTMAVDPNVTSVVRTVRKFEKMETPIREYRDGVEVTDFTQAHSMAAVGSLLGIEIQRAAEAVTESMNADLFKSKCDSTSGWLGFNGLIAFADSSTHSTIYGKVRSAANRLLDSTLANTYDATSEAISVEVIREGYEKVLAHGSSLGDIVIVMHPTQMRLLWNTEDAAIRNNIITMAGAPAAFGFNRTVIPHVDGIPVIRDYRCESSSAAADMFGVVDLSTSKGLNLVISKPLGARGLAKVGTSESAYVSFWGQTVYRSPRNIFVHTALTS